MSYNHAYRKVKPYVVRIEIDIGEERTQCGTGFLLGHGRSGRVAAVATSFHVVSPAQGTSKEILITHEASQKSTSIRLTEDTIRFDEQADCATLIIPADVFPFPQNALPTISNDQKVVPGVPVAWMGFPEPTYAHLCFFAGHISCFLPSSNEYLIDGAAMHGLSGGPVFTECDEEVFLVGTVLSYGPEKERVDGLPGLTLAHHLGIFCEHLAKLG
jgi:hypothetical protein